MLFASFHRRGLCFCMMALNQTAFLAVLQALREERVVAYATEAVFGLGCDPRSECAMQRLLALKKRPVDKGFILVAASEQQLEPFVDFAALPLDIRRMIKATWPGPVTWVVPAKKELSPLLTGGRDTIAVRVSAHPQVRELCRVFGYPLTSTSANLSGLPPCRTLDELYEQFTDTLTVLPSQVGDLQKPTQIRDARTGQILR